MPSTSVCPFCKAPVSTTTTPCPRCGRNASDHPSIAGVAGRTLSTDFEDDASDALVLDAGPDAKGGASRSGGHAASYEGGGVSFDEDLFGDESSGPLELDVPTAHPSNRNAAASPTSGAVPVSHGARGPGAGGPGEADPFDAVPDIPPSSPRDGVRPSGAHPMPGTSGTLPTARPHAGSDPRLHGDPEPGAAAPPSSALGIPSASGSEAPPSPPESGPARVATDPRRAPAPPPDPGALLVARFPPPPPGIGGMPGYFCRVFLRRLELRRDLEALRRKRSFDIPLYEAALRAHDARAYGIGRAITAVLVALGTLIFFSPVIARFLRDD